MTDTEIHQRYRTVSFTRYPVRSMSLQCWPRLLMTCCERTRVRTRVRDDRTLVFFVSLWPTKRFSLFPRTLVFFVSFIYYESTKRKLKTKDICGCRCYERLQTKTKEFTRLSYTELCSCLSLYDQLLVLFMIRCLLWIDEAKANIKPIYECRCNERL